MGTPEDLRGRIFNNWTPMILTSGNRGKGKRAYVTWRCRCVCGVEGDVMARTLKSGLSRGCASCAAERKRRHGFDRAGVNLEVAGTMIVHRSYIGRIRLQAKNYGLEFLLTHEDLERMLAQQDFKCALSGVSIGFASSLLSNRQANLRHTASLNRIDVTRGFTIDNVWWVHKDIGGMKMGLSKSRFVDLCRMVAKAND